MKEIIDAPSLLWSGSGFKEKGGWDPGTCLLPAFQKRRKRNPGKLAVKLNTIRTVYVRK